jgi:hypothetical protein
VTNFTSVSDQPWLQVSPATGTWPLAIQVSPSISGLSAGNYVGHITCTATGSSSSSVIVTVTLSVSAAPSGPVLAVSPTSLNFSAVQGSANPPAASLTITNSGGAVTNFTSVSDQPWLQVSPATGTWPLAIQVSPSISGLSAGNYVGHITCTATGSSSSSVVVTVTLSVSAAPIQHRVDLSWSPSTSSNVVSYRIYRSTTSGGSYGLEASAITGLTYIDSSVQSGATYYYVATDVDQQGQESAYSAEVKLVIP